MRLKLSAARRSPSLPPGSFPRHRSFSHRYVALLIVMAFPATISAAERKVTVHSDPEGASVALVGESQTCKPLNREGTNGTTPCVLSFHSNYLNPSGGLFENSKTLGLPLHLAVSIKGYQPKTITITDGPHVWRGQNIVSTERTFYFIKAQEFHVHLDREISPEAAISPTPNPTSPRTFGPKVRRISLHPVYASFCRPWLWVTLLPEALLRGTKTLTVHSEPEGATVMVAGELQRCKPLNRSAASDTTPCTLSFDNDFFNPSGGLFEDSRILGVPLQLTLSMKGYQSETITITDGPHVWRGKDIHLLERTYYFIRAREFHVQLHMARLSEEPLGPSRTPPTFESEVQWPPRADARQPGWERDTRAATTESAESAGACKKTPIQGHLEDIEACN